MVGCPIFNARNSAWLGVQYLMQGIVHGWVSTI